jgi:hypothetical protein
MGGCAPPAPGMPKASSYGAGPWCGRGAVVWPWGGGVADRWAVARLRTSEAGRRAAGRRGGGAAGGGQRGGGAAGGGRRGGGRRGGGAAGSGRRAGTRLRHDDAVPELGRVEYGPRKLNVAVELGRGRVRGVGLGQELLPALGAWLGWGLGVRVRVRG